MTTSFADGLSEEEFRRSIEARLRENRPEEAVRRLRRLLANDAGPGRILPERFMTVQSADIAIEGWNDLATRIRAHDEPGRAITAISIAFGWPGEEPPLPNAQGHLRPLVEVEYFNDAAYPFSESDRDNLLEGYSYYGCAWAGEGKAIEPTLSLGGVDDLHGALALLEARLLATDQPDEDEIRAGSLGACLLSALLFQAVRDRLAVDPLPRPVCVMAGSNGVYPYFDAPVCGMPATALNDDEAELTAAATYIPGPRYSSLLVTGIPRARKRAVLVVEETDAEAEARIASLRDLPPPQEEPAAPEPVQSRPDPAEPPPDPMAEVANDLPDPGALLLVRRKVEPGQAWDFRDLLTPAPSTAPEPEQKPELATDPAQSDEPGFKSFTIDLDIENRLKALMAEQIARAVAEPRPDAEMPSAEPAHRPSLIRRLLAWRPWRRRA